MSSKTVVVAPIISALLKMEEKLGKDRTWLSINDTQKDFLEFFFSKKGEIVNFNEDELKSWISDNAEELNKILADEGFDIRLEKFDESRNEFGVVSILDLLVEWVKVAGKTDIYYTRKEYPGVDMKSGERTGDGFVDIFKAFSIEGRKDDIVCINTKTGDKFYLTIAPDNANEIDIVKDIEEIRGNKFVSTHYERVHFPMIDYDEEIDISWLIGMNTQDSINNTWVISQAKQQTKFKMNQEGAHLKSAVALGALRGGFHMEKILRIDKPFYLWIEREGVSFPLMYAFFDIDSWKDPKNLEM